MIWLLTKSLISFPWSFAAGFSSETLQALQHTDEDCLMPSSTLSPISVFATTLDQFLHHWDVVEVTLSMLLYLIWQFLFHIQSNNLCYVSWSPVSQWWSSLILLLSVLSPVSFSFISHLLCQWLWLLSVSHSSLRVGCFGVILSVCCRLASFTLHSLNWAQRRINMWQFSHHWKLNGITQQNNGQSEFILMFMVHLYLLYLAASYTS